jgi:tetratricopeptide (TPR) repeat protein
VKTEILPKPIMVGRERELAELLGFLDSAVEGKGVTVFVSGMAGSGKTRLAAEFLDIAKSKGVTVLAGWCLSNAAVPYFPFVEAFDSLTVDEVSSSLQVGLKSLLSRLEKPEIHENNPQIWKDQTFAAITEELLLISTKTPTILFIDDVHWADSASLSLLHYISRAISAERIAVLVSFRSEELNSPSDGQPHPLVDTLRLLRRENLCEEIKLANLQEPEVGKILESMLRNKINNDLTKKLAFETQGNPLFIIESAKMLFEHGSLILEDGEVRLSVDKIDIPLMVKDVILRRISLLKSEQRRILDVASVIGDVFNPKLIGSVLSKDSLQVLEILNDVSQNNSLVFSEERFFRFDHAKSREVLYEEIRSPLRRGYHERIAEIIESGASTCKKPALADLAYHYSQAGNTEKSVHFSLLAGKEALRRFSNVEAIKHFNYVLQTIIEDNQFNFERIEALEGLGDAFYLSMKFKEAMKTFENLSALGGPTRPRALRKAMESAFFQNDFPSLTELVNKAENDSSIDRLENARILSNKGRLLVMQGNLASAVIQHEKALLVFEEEYSLWDTAWALIAIGSTLPFIGQLDRGIAAALRSIKILQELGDASWLIEAYNMAGLTFAVHFGFWKEASELLNKALKLNEEAKVGDYLRQTQINVGLAWVSSAKNDSRGALSSCLIALGYAEKTDSNLAKGMAYSNLAIQYTIIEDFQQAEEYFNKLMQLPPPVLMHPIINAPLATAIFFAGKKQWNECNQIFSRLLEPFKSHPDLGYGAMLKMPYAWALMKQGHLEEAGAQFMQVREIYEKIERQFKHVNLQTALVAPIKVEYDRTFEMRFDIVNISREQGTVVQIANTGFEGFDVISLSENSIQHGNILELKEKNVPPFDVVAVQFVLKPRRVGVFKLNLQLVYLDDQGGLKTSNTSSVTITVSSKSSIAEVTTKLDHTSAIIEFNSEASRKAFDFLVSSFKEDYDKLRLPQERAGWRTLMDIVRQGNVSRYSIYGSSGIRGQAISELERAGLIEARAFVGERGRGGKIFKIRICFEKEIVKAYTQKK